MTDERITAYLLKDLPEEELVRFEDECFASENWPAQVGLVEEELIEDYLRNELTPEQRRSFEGNYLTTAARMERVRIAAALLRHLDACAPAAEATAAAAPLKQTWVERLRVSWGGRRWVPRVAVALPVLALIIGVWLFSGPSATRKPEATFAMLTLTISNGDRAEGIQASRVKLARGIDALRISLILPDMSASSTRYRAQLEDDDGSVKLSENVVREAQSVQVTIPASQLARGQYVVKLFAINPDGIEQRIPGGYVFIVE
jgi:hypothetical protein